MNRRRLRRWRLGSRCAILIRSGLLHGVPISVKSSVDVAGWPCECGSRLRQGYVPAEDATLVTRLRGAGAILLGNTNVPEFLMAYETDNALYGRTNSPWDLERTPGGSSGGEAAAIAAGCSAGGVGSDGGGSIRVPAHFSGICGLKPTPGRVPSYGTLSCVGGAVFAVGGGGADGADGGGCGAIVCGDGWAGHWRSGIGAGTVACVERSRKF